MGAASFARSKNPPPSVAKSLDRQLHGPLGDFEIAAVERRFIGVEQRGGSEDLIVERTFEARAADAVEETFRRVPRFRENAVERLQREIAAIGLATSRPSTRAASRYAETNIAFQPT